MWVINHSDKNLNRSLDREAILKAAVSITGIALAVGVLLAREVCTVDFVVLLHEGASLLWVNCNVGKCVPVHLGVVRLES